MYRITAKETLVQTIQMMKIEAPAVSRKGKAGQFIIVRTHERGERIPLTIADMDPNEGTVTIVFQEVGKSTRELGMLNAGDWVQDFVGPLGIPTHVGKLGTVVCVAGGVGVAPIHPIARAFKQAGNKVITVMGARSKNLLFWEDRLRAFSDELIVTTDDGSYGRKGVVTVPLKEVLERPEKIAEVIAIGPVVMMKFCCVTTKPFNVKTTVSLNSLMLDGTGMCGCCRVSAAGQTKFVCVDGPDFDGHSIDWDLFQARQGIYLDEEKLAVQEWERCGCANAAQRARA